MTHEVRCATQSPSTPVAAPRRLLPCLVTTGLFIALYTPVFAHLLRTWQTNEYASHGYAIPAIAGFFAWRRWPRVQASRATGGRAGLFVLGLALALYLFGVASRIHLPKELSLPLALAGIVLHLRGPDALRALWFPLTFSLLMIGWPNSVIEWVSFPMQLAAAKYSAMALGLMGAPVERDGVNLAIPGYTFAVTVKCSGMQSLLALTALGAALAYALEGPPARRMGLFALTIPIAVLANSLRVAAILMLAMWKGPRVAEGFFHGFSGFVLFLLATLGLLGAALALRLKRPTWENACRVNGADTRR